MAPAMQEVVGALGKRADLVLLAAGQAGEARTEGLASHADLVLLEVPVGRATAREVREAVSALSGEGRVPAGIVLLAPGPAAPDERPRRRPPPGEGRPWRPAGPGGSRGLGRRRLRRGGAGGPRLHAVGGRPLLRHDRGVPRAGGGVDPRHRGRVRAVPPALRGAGPGRRGARRRPRRVPAGDGHRRGARCRDGARGRGRRSRPGAGRAHGAAAGAARTRAPVRGGGRPGAVGGAGVRADPLDGGRRPRAAGRAAARAHRGRRGRRRVAHHARRRLGRRLRRLGRRGRAAGGRLPPAPAVGRAPDAARSRGRPRALVVHRLPRRRTRRPDRDPEGRRRDRRRGRVAQRGRALHRGHAVRGAGPARHRGAPAGGAAPLHRDPPARGRRTPAATCTAPCGPGTSSASGRCTWRWRPRRPRTWRSSATPTPRATPGSSSP